MKAVASKEVFDLSLKLNQVSIEMLNDCLKEAGISSKKKREEICSRFLFSAGSFQDSMWIESKRKKYRPVTAFKQHTGIDVPAKQILVPTADDLPLHEVAHFEVGAFFKHGEKAPVQTGEIYDD